MNAQEAAQQAEVARSAAIEGKRKCEALLANPDFQWFFRLAIEDPWNTAEAKLHDLKTPKDERENAAHVAEALREAKVFLAKNAEIFDRQIPH